MSLKNIKKNIFFDKDRWGVYTQVAKKIRREINNKDKRKGKYIYKGNIHGKLGVGYKTCSFEVKADNIKSLIKKIRTHDYKCKWRKVI